MADLVVDIVTPVKLVYSGPAQEVRVPGALGDFGILPQHTEFLSLVRAGVATVVSSAGNRRFVVGRGFAEAGPDRVIILADSAEDGAGVDKAAAKQALEMAIATLETEPKGSEAWLAAEREAELNKARLAV